jgi:prepilin-type N-terminal cleavage/methylation domain-containing protein
MKQEKGFSLIEVMLAIALMGVVAIAFLGALATGSKAIFIADERATAESLARTEMEYVRSQEYSAAPWAYELPSGTPPADPPTWWDPGNPHALPEGYDGYTVNVSTERLDPKGDGFDSDDGLQKIIVVVYPYDAEDPDDWVVKLVNYRSLR